MKEPELEGRTDPNFEYSFGSIFVLDARAELADSSWSKSHERQGFSRGPGSLQFATLTQFGSAELQLKFQQYTSEIKFERVIAAPLEINSDSIEIGSIESASSPIILSVEPGQYRVVVAQKLLGEDDIGGGRELIHVYFEKTQKSIDKSEILVCDDDLDPPDVLVEK